jgi:endonuclease/exonuclease/phosphatase family metal-dependent hydrolase
MDAGGAPGDRAAREQQVEQLLATLEARSTGQPVIVAGDTNMDDQDDALLARLLERAQLRDACRTLNCRAPKMIDRVMFRGSDRVQLRAVRLEIDPRFVGDDGRDLSDHKAVGTVFRWDLAAPKIAKAEPHG